jgi:hypothetical protein
MRNLLLTTTWTGHRRKAECRLELAPMRGILQIIPLIRHQPRMAQQTSLKFITPHRNCTGMPPRRANQ